MSTDRVTVIGMHESLIERAADIACRCADGADLSRTAFVFGGRRPGLFLRRELGRRLGRVFVPPPCLSMDEFIARCAYGRVPGASLPHLDELYLLFLLIREVDAGILVNRERFPAFAPWAQEVFSFIEQLDLEDVPSESLRAVQLQAEIGFDVPDSVNRLLRCVAAVRDRFHREVLQRNAATRGMRYRAAAERPPESLPYGQVVFVAPFHLHATERAVVAGLVRDGRARVLVQGGTDRWPVLRSLLKDLGAGEQVTLEPSGHPRVTLHEGADMHAQAGIVRQIIRTVPHDERTVIVVPEPDSLMPLLAELSGALEQYNVSLGFPLRRSPVYALVDLVLRAQASRSGEAYHAGEYLEVLRHPFVQSLGDGVDDEGGARLAGALVETVDRALRGEIPTRFSGELFVRPAEIAADPAIAGVARDVLQRDGVAADRDRLCRVLHRLHETLFTAWERCTTVADLAAALDSLLSVLAEHGRLEEYPPNLAVAGRLLETARELAGSLLAGERFAPSELFRLLRERVEEDVVSFSGSPLAGVQVLGLFETRALDFDTVVIMDVNESVLPRLRVHEPLIPRDVMLALGLDRLEREEEIQRYQFMRLIAGARDVHLVYRVGGDAERSRFIEMLVWERERAGSRRSADRAAVQTERWSFAFAPLPAARPVPKTEEVVGVLRTMHYSASAVDTYLNCPLRFHYQYVLRLREAQEPGEEPGSGDIGTFLHDLLEKMYARFVGKNLRIDAAFRRAFMQELDRRFAEQVEPRMRADAFMVHDIIRYRMERFLDAEERRLEDAPVRVAAVEKEYAGSLRVDGVSVAFRARIDRVDLVAGTAPLILDYKSGSAAKTPRLPVEVPSTDIRRILKETVRSFQLPVYIHCHGTFRGMVPDAALYSLREPEELSPLFAGAPPSERPALMKGALEGLRALMREVFDPAVPFAPDDSEPTYCGICPYQSLCR